MKQAPVLTERDVKRVLQHCAQTAFPDRNRAVFQLGYLSGMRIGEIAALKVSDVLAEDGAVRSVIQLTAAQTKGREARTVRVSTQLQTELAAYLLTLPPTFIQRERDSGFEFCLFGRVGQRGLARSFAGCAASGPVAV